MAAAHSSSLNMASAITSCDKTRSPSLLRLSSGCADVLLVARGLASATPATAESLPVSRCTTDLKLAESVSTNCVSMTVTFTLAAGARLHDILQGLRSR
ncbi:hypothetical protein OPV22_025792 [Ensete ventricosum]|uniref:VAN3-binding protein-like auxin canalisation domain-containing protein n=1 Tax=Ensete ventricosum TaxID=4639 RepID=A0AAV8Q4Q5_ENSVE|nr:hypothetical protein OPV22_025792 [Ensete ventricosum]